MRLVASQIDARQFNRSFPAVFPRFVQLAIWRYCSQQGLDICNGNRIAMTGIGVKTATVGSTASATEFA